MVKTALELALEKVAKMPKLDSEALEGQKKEELETAGNALANRLISGKLHEKDLESEFKTYQGESLRVVRKAILDTLKGSIVLDDPTANDRIISLACLVNERLKAEELTSAIGEVIEEYQEELHLVQLGMIEKKKKAYAEMGISGSGFVPNVFNGERWEAESAELGQLYLEKLPDFNL